MKNRIEKLLEDALAALPAGTLGDAPLPDPAIERTRDAQHGDFATGVAMRLAKAARANGFTVTPAGEPARSWVLCLH